jgi:hypothetical protein
MDRDEQQRVEPLDNKGGWHVSDMDGGLERTEVMDAASVYRDLSCECALAEPCEPRQPTQTMASLETDHPVSTRRRGAPMCTM